MNLSSILQIGFFQERFRKSYSSIAFAARLDKPFPDIGSICNYLSQTPSIVISPGIINSLVPGDNTILGPIAIKTDGKHAWPSELTHYLKVHSFALDEGILTYIRNQN